MKIKQLSIFLQNKMGSMYKPLKILKENNINIKAMSMADTSEFAILRLVVDNPLKGKEVLILRKGVRSPFYQSLYKGAHLAGKQVGLNQFDDFFLFIAVDSFLHFLRRCSDIMHSFCGSAGILIQLLIIFHSIRFKCFQNQKDSDMDSSIILQIYKYILLE